MSKSLPLKPSDRYPGGMCGELDPWKFFRTWHKIMGEKYGMTMTTTSVIDTRTGQAVPSPEERCKCAVVLSDMPINQ